MHIPDGSEVAINTNEVFQFIVSVSMQERHWGISLKMSIVPLVLIWTVLWSAGAFGQENQHVIQPPTQEELAREIKAVNLWQASESALNARHYSLAESDARMGLSADPDFTAFRRIIASALLAQGKTREAVSLLSEIIKSNDILCDASLPYALILVRGGHWAYALSLYNRVLPTVGSIFRGPDLLVENNDYSVDDPEPTALEADIHIALGIEEMDDYGINGPPSTQNKYDEFKKAYALEPDSQFARLCYAKGLHAVGKEDEARSMYREVMEASSGRVKAEAERELGLYTPPPPDPNAPGSRELLP